MLTNRPLVVGDEARVEVRLRAGRDVEVYAALDGQETFAFADGDHVVVTGSPRRLKLVKAPGRDYYEVLRTKLKWGDAGRPAAEDLRPGHRWLQSLHAARKSFPLNRSVRGPIRSTPAGSGSSGKSVLRVVYSTSIETGPSTR